MKRNFPVYVLNIIVPFEDVDVNVHQIKEVRFATSSKILGSLYNAIKQALEEYEQQTRDNLFKTDLSIKNNSNKSLAFDATTKPDENNKMFIEKENDKQHIEKKISNLSSNNDFLDTKEEILIENYSFFDFYSKKREKIEKHENKETNKYNESINSYNYNVIGQIFGTYILIEYNNELYFIDQHAIHERIIFDDLMAQINDITNIIVQPLLVPLTLDFENDEYEILSQNLKYLNDIGFSVELFGINTIKFNSIPIIFKNVNIHKFITLIAQYLLSEEKMKLQEIAKDIIAKMACSAAIKGNTQFSQEEIKSIFHYLLKNNFPEQCPHGRPTFLKFSKIDIEKKFKRR